jgi:hypothetical protein
MVTAATLILSAALLAFSRGRFLIRHRVGVRPHFTETDQCSLPVGADI